MTEVANQKVKSSFFHRLGITLFVWFLLIAFVPAGLIGWQAFKQAREGLEREEQRSLFQAIQLRKTSIEDKIKKVVDELNFQAELKLNAELLQDLRSSFLEKKMNLDVFVRSFAHAKISVEKGIGLKEFRRVFNYHDVLLIDVDGNILYSVSGGEDLGLNVFDGELAASGFGQVCRESFEKSKMACSDFEKYAPSDGVPSIFMTQVIADEDGVKVGLIAFRLNWSIFNSAMEDTMGLGNTGRAYLVGKDGYMRSGVRDINNLTSSVEPKSKTGFLTSSILNQIVQTRVVHDWQANQNDDFSEIKYYKDYESRDVLGVLLSFEYIYTNFGLSWAFVAEKEIDEIFVEERRLKNALLALFVVTALSILILAFILTRRIVRPITVLNHWARQIIEGRLTLSNKKVNQSSNEIGQLSRSFAKMVTTLKEARAANEEESWFKTGQSQLSEKLRGDKDIQKMTKEVLVFLTRYLKTNVGTFYVVNKNGNYYLEGTYAYHKKEQLNAELFPGQGLVGEAALEKKHILLEEVPEDYLRIESSMGSASVCNVLAYPIIRQNKVLGIIELASINSIDENAIRLLDLANESIAMAIAASLSKMELASSLEKTQSQAAELQSQQSELKAVNDKLVEQTDELKRSEETLKMQGEELKATNEELEEKQVALKQQADDLETAKREIEKKADDLALASKYKSEFLANMSHELRTPLNGLLLLSKGLMSNKQGNLTDKQVQHAKVIYEGGNDLLCLINDIMDLSKVEAGMMQINIDQMLFDNFTRMIRNLFDPLSLEKGISFDIEAHRDLPKSLMTDEQRLEQIVKNFLSNAFKFTEKGGEILLKIYRAKDVKLNTAIIDAEQCMAFAVSDTGTGISKDKQDAIFEAFQQADGTTSRQYGGTGLGLAISRKLAGLLGGEIQLESTEGEGSTFTLYLPMNIERKGTITKQIDEEKDSVEAEVSVMSTERIESVDEPAYLPDDRHNISAGDRIILVIEDDKSFAEILKNLIKEVGYKCLVAGSGRSGLYLAMDFEPLGIILDLGLPDVDGLKVLEQLKHHVKTSHIPVHIVSAAGNKGASLDKGAVGFLNKPASTEDLNKVLEGFSKTIGGEIRKLLLVEDDRNIRETMSNILGNTHLTIDTTALGQDALQLLREKEYHCMVLDLSLPDLSGFEVLERASEDEAINLPAVVIYTARNLTEEEMGKLSKYSNDVILKGANSVERLLDATSLFLHQIDLQEENKTSVEINDSIQNDDVVFKGRKILLVDDDMRNTYALSGELMDLGLDVTMAENGQVAINKLEVEDDFEIILMDIMMPVMDGYEAMKIIRKMPKYQKTPIIALTAKAMPGDRASCIEAGASEYINKPVDLDKLLSVMRVWLYQEAST